MKKIVLMAIVLLGLAACSGSVQYSDWNALQGEWQIVQVGAERVELDKEGGIPPLLGFSKEDNRVYGYLGCNQLTGALVIHPEDVTVADFSSVGRTMMLCEDMALEDAILAALAQVRHYQISEENHLQLFNADGQVMMTLKMR
ncbi:MAG: META domain-containing protein [Bacteroidales bacterium]|nr:META domain-containing protein [Bacteroidales bacterium]